MRRTCGESGTMNMTMQLLSIVMIAIAVATGTPLGTFVVARWIVGPVDDAAKARQAPARFYMIDALAFLTLFQAALVFPTWAHREGVTELAIPIGVMIVGAAGAFWVGAIRALSRAGVHQALRRAIFVLLVLPAAGFGNFAVAGLALGCMASADRGESLASLLCFAAMISLVPALFFTRRVTLWVLAERNLPV
jgi:hypothetical protein